MFEKILELLASLAVAAAGLVGINVAADHAAPPATDAALNGAASHSATTLKSAAGLSRAETARAEGASLGPTNGLARALEALTQAVENAPEQADEGLAQAIEAVTESPANDAPAGAAGPPAELPDGRP
jgi:hypothetical protein